MENKIHTILSEKQLNYLLSQTAQAMPDNPTQQKWTEKQIKEHFYQGFIILFNYLKAFQIETKENDDLTDKNIEDINKTLDNIVLSKNQNIEDGSIATENNGTYILSESNNIYKFFKVIDGKYKLIFSNEVNAVETEGNVLKKISIKGTTYDLSSENIKIIKDGDYTKFTLNNSDFYVISKGKNIGNNSIAIGSNSIAKNENEVSFDSPDVNRFLSLFDTSKVVFRNENVNEESGNYLNAKSLKDYLNQSAARIEASVNNQTYVLTFKLFDTQNRILSTAEVDLPLESVVVNGKFDEATKKVILTLVDGSTIEFSIADLIEGLQSTINSSNKLNADYVDDSNSLNKFISEEEKQNITENSAVRHSHDNKSILDETTAPFTTEEKNKLSGLTNYTLPIASSNSLGGVKAVGKTEEMDEEVGIDNNGKLYSKGTTVEGNVALEGNEEAIKSIKIKNKTYKIDGNTIIYELTRSSDHQETMSDDLYNFLLSNSDKNIILKWGEYYYFYSKTQLSSPYYRYFFTTKHNAVTDQNSVGNHSIAYLLFNLAAKISYYKEVEIQAKLRSGHSIKTINNESILGAGNLDVSKTAIVDLGTISSNLGTFSEEIITNLTNAKGKNILIKYTSASIVCHGVLTNSNDTEMTFIVSDSGKYTEQHNIAFKIIYINLSSKAYQIVEKNYQESLRSGENIKTINEQSLIGSGNIEISGGESDNITIDLGTLSSSGGTLSSEILSQINNNLGNKSITFEGTSNGMSFTTSSYAIAGNGLGVSFLQGNVALTLVITLTTGSYTISQATLLDSVDVKTINGQSIVGAGNIEINGSNFQIIDVTSSSKNNSISSLYNEITQIFDAEPPTFSNQSEIYNNIATAVNDGFIPILKFTDGYGYYKEYIETSNEYIFTINHIILNSEDTNLTNNVIILKVGNTDNIGYYTNLSQIPYTLVIQDAFSDSGHIDNIEQMSLFVQAILYTESNRIGGLYLYNVAEMQLYNIYSLNLQSTGSDAMLEAYTIINNKMVYIKFTGGQGRYDYTKTTYALGGGDSNTVVIDLGALTEENGTLSPTILSEINNAISENKHFVIKCNAGFDVIFPNVMYVAGSGLYAVGFIFTGDEIISGTMLMDLSSGQYVFGNFDLQEKLVSGTNIKTINGQSLIGSGDLQIAAGSAYATDDEVNNLFTNPGQPIPERTISLENLNAFKQQIDNEIGKVLEEGF